MSKKGKKKPVSTSQDTVSSEEKISAKKAAVLGTNKKKSSLPLVVSSVCLFILVSGAVAYRASQNDTNSTAIAETSVQPQTLAPAAEKEASDVIMYPTVQFSSGMAQHFQYQTGDLTIKYFILKSSDGIIRAAFDACDVCWPAGKGYYQDGDVMVCRNCGRRFPSTKINEVQGGCNPAPLNRIIKDGQVVLEVKDILEGKQYFDFSQS